MMAATMLHVQENGSFPERAPDNHVCTSSYNSVRIYMDCLLQSQRWKNRRGNAALIIPPFTTEARMRFVVPCRRFRLRSADFWVKSESTSSGQDAFVGFAWISILGFDHAAALLDAAGREEKRRRRRTRDCSEYPESTVPLWRCRFQEKARTSRATKMNGNLKMANAASEECRSYRSTWCRRFCIAQR